MAKYSLKELFFWFCVFAAFFVVLAAILRDLQLAGFLDLVWLTGTCLVRRLFGRRPGIVYSMLCASVFVGMGVYVIIRYRGYPSYSSPWGDAFVLFPILTLGLGATVAGIAEVVVALIEKHLSS